MILRHQPRPGPDRLRRVDQHRIRAEAAHANIVDRALRGPELCPRPLPGVLELNRGCGSARDHHRDKQHRRRPLDLTAFSAKELCGSGAIEKHSEIGDVAVRTDLLALDDDRTHDLVQRAVGEVWGLVDRQLVHLGPQGTEALPLRDPPSPEARGLRVGTADIDVDAA